MQIFSIFVGTGCLREAKNQSNFWQVESSLVGNEIGDIITLVLCIIPNETYASLRFKV